MRCSVRSFFAALTDRARTATWALSDLWDDMDTPGRALSVAASVVTIVAVVAVVAVLWLSGESRSYQMAADRLEQVADGLRADPERAIEALPPGVVGRFDGVAEDRYSGTVAVDADGKCLGLHVTVGSGWVLDGDPEAFDVSDPVVLDPERCESV